MGFAGILLVLGAVLGGYLMEGGEIGVLIQPAEIVIIMGAGLGSVLISTPAIAHQGVDRRHDLEDAIFRVA